MRYRIETNDTRRAASQWYDIVPNGTCASLNMAAYHAGQSGLYGIYRSDGTRVQPGDADDV